MLRPVECYVFGEVLEAPRFPAALLFTSRHENTLEDFKSMCPLYSKRRHLIIRKVFNMEELVTKRIKMIHTCLNHLSNT
jgi:hypothetical protein